MAISVLTNSISLTAQNNLNSSQSKLGQAIERLSSGLQINSAKDNAAGQAIANRLQSSINGLNQAATNANDGISLAQTAEGALDEINDNLQSIRTLVVQAANGTNSTSDLASIQEEITARLAEIDRIAEQTSYNGKDLLNTDNTTISLQIGTEDGQTISFTLNSASSANLGSGVATLDVTTADFASGTTLAEIDAAISEVDSQRSSLGSIQNRLESTINNLTSTTTNLSDAQSRIQDADYATEVSNMSKAQILQQAGASVLSQANAVPQIALTLLQG
ncbi:flagellin N-terminal helical domain-containing protein [Brenneria tiliae]|uniref:flagellin N-terminal helical domain-containing protein n=1 Tax=Brenneria tiliae TaxID=2914984 RepID=UPI002014B41F|nr:flagellin [Brenneria tiliae]MCL2899845.1 flagellin FliC [Brenneria tiliae]MCL2904666.1 flagellin FliC [Brenneria tiliae]